jgi:hypothetical protein
VETHSSGEISTATDAFHLYRSSWAIALYPKAVMHYLDVKSGKSLQVVMSASAMPKSRRKRLSSLL